MQISVTGLSHHTAPVSVRERFAVAPEHLLRTLEALYPRLGATAVLSTCNRTEVYIAAAQTPSADEVVSALTDTLGVATPEGLHFFQYNGIDAARHLFRVAASVDSLVVGESEVLGQVRTAFAASTAAKASNAVLARLFHAAIRTGRRARSETEIGQHGLSVSATAAKLSRQVLGDLRRKAVLVVGAGEAGQLAAQALVQQGASRLLVTTRNHERAQDIAAELNGLTVPFAELPAAIAEVDIVVTCTSAPETIISAADVAAAMRRRPERRLVMVDIAVPRDIEPAAASIEGVQLFDIDDLQAAADENLRARNGEVAAVEAIVEEELLRFEAWLKGQRVMPTIAGLSQQAEAARLKELQATLARMDLTDEERARIDAMTRAIVKRILHTPLKRLRRDDGLRRIEAARDLFGLDDAPEHGWPTPAPRL